MPAGFKSIFLNPELLEDNSILGAVTQHRTAKREVCTIPLLHRTPLLRSTVIDIDISLVYRDMVSVRTGARR